MKKHYPFFVTVAMAMFVNYAQAQCDFTPCSTPQPSFDATTACVLSSEYDLDCYFGETLDSPPVSLPPYWCSSVENNQWFAFTASSNAVSFEIFVDFCAAGGALQAAILQSFDCVNFDFVSDCYGNITSGSSQLITNNVPLNPGQVYYLMIDGSAGAKCGFSINASSSFQGPSMICIPSPPVAYYASGNSTWTISPQGAGTILTPQPSNAIQVQWNLPGAAIICCNSQTCASLPTFCLDVFVGESPVDTITQYLCPGEMVFCGGTAVTSPGTYQYFSPSPNGCDSIFICNVVGIPESNANLGVQTMPCLGFFTVCGDTIYEIGANQVVCQNWLGCDSTISFVLQPGDVLADAGPDANISCSTSQPMLDGSGSSAGTGFSYLWTTADGSILSGETSLSPTVAETGNYCLTVTNLATGCIMTDCANVTLSIGLPTITIAPATVPCDGSAVQLQATTSAGSNAIFTWGTNNGVIVSGANTANPLVASPGTYCLTVTGANGCSKTSCTTIDSEIDIDILGATEFCLENNTKTFSVNTFTSAQNLQLFLQVNDEAPTQVAQSGGVSGYLWDVTLTEPTTLQAWAIDSTGCATDTAVHHIDLNTATIEFDLQQNSCNFVTIHAQLEGPYQTNPGLFNWSNGVFGTSTYITQDGWYSASATDNYGCHWVDSIYATVDFLGLCAKVQGTVRKNLLADCLPNAADVPMAGRIVRASNANGTYYGTTDANGNYTIHLTPGNYTLTVLLPASTGFGACSNNFTINLPFAGSTVNQDFLLRQLSDCPFMTVDVGNNLLRRCLNNTYYVQYCNQGAALAEDAHLLLTLDPALTFVTATLPHTDLGNNVYRFELGDVQSGHCSYFLVNAFLSCSVPIGQVHCVLAEIFPDTLCTGYGPSDFTDQDCRPNIGSYDPNAKTATPPGIGNQHLIAAGTELTYHLRFQNTGTDTAFQVVIRDTLADRFDLSTLQPGISSHPYSMAFFGQNILRFTFDDIGLPPVGENELGSIGFVDFKIRLKPDLAPQTLIENTASIYFDFNEPVVTNTYFHTIGEPDAETFLTEHICQGETYDFNGQNLTQAGNYMAELTSYLGGDSIVHLNLVVSPTVITELEAQICEGESIVFNGETLTQSGDYKVTYQTVFGCDSIVNFSLDVWPTFDLTPTVAICTGTTYPFGGQQLDQPGVYIGEFSSDHGCDSTVTLTLLVVDSLTTTLNDAICEGETYVFDGQTLVQSGVYTANYTSIGGCDSTVTLNLTIYPSYTVNLSVSVCEGEAGTYLDSLQTIHGCDSIIIVDITVLPTASEGIEASICEGQSYVFNGQVLTQAGTYTSVLTAANGCDSIVSLLLLVEPAPITNLETTVVQGTVYNGITLLADTTITEVLTDINGCESILITHFTVLPSSTQDLQELLDFELFPNPTGSDFSIRFQLPQQWGGVRLKIMDVMGREMPDNALPTHFAAGGHLLRVAASAWPSGVYFVHFQTDRGGLVEKVVVE